ncbi:MAG: response regulator [Elusimicrobiota bacterium]|nr:response regulator [Elusimicrobiota bacterium]
MPVSILVADDEKAMLRLYLRIFAGSGYSISTAGTFAEAAALLRKNSYDLLITDFIFPDGVGTELIKIFNEVKAGSRSLLVTGTPYAREKLAKQGVHRYIEKPFKMELLLDAVSKALW